MLELMKQIANQTGEAMVPARFLFGTVTKTDPLTVFVDNRFPLSSPALVVLRELNGHTHAVPQSGTEAANGHSHLVPQNITEKENTAGLTEGDKVVLLRNQGGQSYLILGRI